MVKYSYLWDGTKLSALDNDGNGLVYAGSLVYRKQNGVLSLESIPFSMGRIVATSWASGSSGAGGNGGSGSGGSGNGGSGSAGGDGAGSGSSGDGFAVHYHMIDHLGSVRAVVDGANGQVIERNDYYPFGLRWQDPNQPVSDNRYRYNGKEEQSFLNLPFIDYGWRQYDAKYGRWFGHDKQSEKYYPVSPYAFCGNNPIFYIDPNGMISMDFQNSMETKYYNEQGDLMYETNDGLPDCIIVRDAEVKKLREKLQETLENGTISDPETNREEVHVLGRTPEEYTEEALKGGGSDEWRMGYKATYKETFEGKSAWGILVTTSVVAMGGDEGPIMHKAGAQTGAYEGKTDRKSGKINRVQPYHSLKNNLPLIKLKDNSEIYFPYPGIGLPPK